VEAEGTVTAVGSRSSDEDHESESMGQWLQLYEDSLKDLEEGIVRDASSRSTTRSDGGLGLSRKA